MRTAKCIWPIEDPSITRRRAISKATLDLPRLLSLNEWHPVGEPRDWAVVEGVNENNQPRLYLRCFLDILETPREFHHYRWEDVDPDAHRHGLELAAA